MSGVAVILSEILALTDQNDLSQVYDAFRIRSLEVRTQKSLEARATLKAGDKVSFDSRRQGRRVSGKIDKVNWTKAVVRVNNPDGTDVLWTVPLSMLQKSEQGAK